MRIARLTGQLAGRLSGWRVLIWAGLDLQSGRRHDGALHLLECTPKTARVLVHGNQLLHIAPFGCEQCLSPLC